VAFINRHEKHHAWALDVFARLSPPLLTCEAVFSEATYLLRRSPGASVSVLELAQRHLVRPSFRLDEEAMAVKTLMARYRDVQMDLADACLVRLAEIHSDCVLVTVDSEFRDVYRRHGRQMIPTLMPPAVSGRVRPSSGRSKRP